MSVSVIYVNWNSTADILTSMASVQHWTQTHDHEFIVVDNASHEDISKLDRDDLTLIRNSANLGFATGCNIGAKQAQGDFLLFLNPDTVLLNDVLGGLVSFLNAHPEAGIAGPMTLDPDGSIHYAAARALPGLVNEFLEHSTLTFKFARNRLLGRPYYSYWDHQSSRPVGTLLGACMMLRRDAFETLGGFDENYFLFFEEVDLCKRMHQAGWQVWYVHTCRLLHEGHRSIIREYGRVDALFPVYLESAEKYFKTHHGRPYAFLWRLMLAGIYLAPFLRRRRPELWTTFKWGLGRVQHHHANLQ
jgi:GT2 family glycosyltransferase